MVPEHLGGLPRGTPKVNTPTPTSLLASVFPSRGAHGALGPWGQPPGGLPSSAGGCPRQLDSVCLAHWVGSHGHPEGRGIDKLSLGAPGPDGPPPDLI